MKMVQLLGSRCCAHITGQYLKRVTELTANLKNPREGEGIFIELKNRYLQIISIDLVDGLIVLKQPSTLLTFICPTLTFSLSLPIYTCPELGSQGISCSLIKLLSS